MKIGDKVTTSELYLIEGMAYFGKNLLHRKLNGIIIKIYENTTGKRDSFNNIVEDVVIVKHKNGVDSFCKKFLKLSKEKESLF